MAALRVIRAIEGEAVAGKASVLTVQASLDAAVYILNHHRDWLKRIEEEQNVSIQIIPDREKAGDDFTLEKSGAPRERSEAAPVIQADQKDMIELDEVESEDDAEEQSGGERKKRRRRRRRKDAARGEADAEASPAGDESAESTDASEQFTGEEPADADTAASDGEIAAEQQPVNQHSAVDSADAHASDDTDQAEPIEASARPHANGASHDKQPQTNGVAEASAEEPRANEETEELAEQHVEDLADAPQPSPSKRKRRGWWSKGGDA